jgi:hypothetical protein
MYSHLLKAGQARTTFIAYTGLIILSILVFTIVDQIIRPYGKLEGMEATVFGVLFVLSDIPVAISAIITIRYGYLWEEQDFRTLVDMVQVYDYEHSVSSDTELTPRRYE